MDLRLSSYPALAAEILQTLLEVEVSVEKVSNDIWQLVFENHCLPVVGLASSWPKEIKKAAGELTNWNSNERPLLVVPFMGPAGKELCREMALSWLDLSGNVHIRRRNLIVHVEGRPNRFAQVGRPASLFAPKSSRLARWLLMHPNESFSQSELQRALNLDAGYLSRLLKRMRQAGHLVGGDGIQVQDPRLLLEAWREGYHIQAAEERRFHVPARSGTDLQARVASWFKKHDSAFAMTGLGAAWLYTQFAGFRQVTAYLSEAPDWHSLAGELSAEEVQGGANLWVILPKDQGVLQGAEEVQGIPCVHPLQVFLDLKDHPERAAEAASMLRQQCLPWSLHG